MISWMKVLTSIMIGLVRPDNITMNSTNKERSHSAYALIAANTTAPSVMMTQTEDLDSLADDISTSRLKAIDSPRKTLQLILCLSYRKSRNISSPGHTSGILI